jgi:hypothetical protein
MMPTRSIVLDAGVHMGTIVLIGRTIMTKFTALWGIFRPYRVI